MHRALESAIGLPSISTSASWMLAFLIPADVRRSFKLPPWRWGAGLSYSRPSRGAWIIGQYDPAPARGRKGAVALAGAASGVGRQRLAVSRSNARSTESR